MLRRPEPFTFESKLVTAPVAVTALWRLSKYPRTEPFFARDGQHRFDDPHGRPVHPVGVADFGVLYAGQDPETAFCESVIHENSQFVNGRFEVPRAQLYGRSLVEFTHPRKRELQLADLTGDALKSLGLNNDISAGDDYDISQAWARAIHGARQNFDGIRYVSRQRNAAFCYAVFDRSGLVLGSWAPVTDATVNALCLAFNVQPL